MLRALDPLREDRIFLFLDLSTVSPSFYVRILFDRVAQHSVQYELTNSPSNYFRFVHGFQNFFPLFVVVALFKAIVSLIVPFSSFFRGLRFKINYLAIYCTLAFGVKIQQKVPSYRFSIEEFSSNMLLPLDGIF